MIQTDFISIFSDRLSDYLAFRQLGGIEPKSQYQLLSYFDRFVHDLDVLSASDHVHHRLFLGDDVLGKGLVGIHHHCNLGIPLINTLGGSSQVFLITKSPRPKFIP